MIVKCARFRIAAVFAVSAAALAGCHSNPAPPAPPRPEPAAPVVVHPTTAVSEVDDPVIARVNDIEIHRRQLDQPLIEAYGLTMFLNIVQLDLAKQQAERFHVVVTPDDIQQERDRTFAHMFSDAPKSDYDQLLQQFLRQQHLSRIEFDMVIETNAYLRKLAEPQLAGKLTEDRVRAAFNQLYGENRVVHDIQLTNVPEAGEAKRRIAAGKTFEEVAREMSLDRRTGALGGELPAFSAQSPNVPQPLKDAAFSLQIGQVSDPLAVGETTHLIKLVSIIPPKIGKYEDVKDSVRQELTEQWLDLAVKEFRNQLAQLALKTMNIEDPVLKAQWQERLDQQNSRIRDRDSAIAEMNRQRESGAATQPAASLPSAPAVQRPPATMPGVNPPGVPASTQPR